KNFITAASSHEGEFDTSTTTEAPFRASASPSPVRVLTPELGDAATASCPFSRSFLTSFDPMSPVPPITTIFIFVSLIFQPQHFETCLSYLLRPNIPTLVSFLRNDPLVVCARRCECGLFCDVAPLSLSFEQFPSTFL